MRINNLINNFVNRANNGEELTVAFLGGSITEGVAATEERYAYSYRVYEGLCNIFNRAKLNYINAGIGGTDSYYGVSRVVTDVLMYQPDLVVVDFSVNDTRGDLDKETFEGLIRRILNWNSHPGIIVLNNICYDTGITAQDRHNEIADYYGVPHVSVRDTIYRKIQMGEYQEQEITSDSLHPNDHGHKLIADEIVKLIRQIIYDNDKGKISDVDFGAGANWKLPDPITRNAYENAKRLTIREVCPKLDGFKADFREKAGHLDHFKNGWIGRKPKDKVVFNLKGTCIGVQYRKTIERPAVRARMILDGDVEHSVLLDGNFDEDWGDCLYIQPVLHHGEEKEHILEIEIIDDEYVDTTPFYLMSVIVA